MSSVRCIFVIEGNPSAADTKRDTYLTAMMSRKNSVVLNRIHSADCVKILVKITLLKITFNGSPELQM
jgi:hypothetical protein